MQIHVSFDYELFFGRASGTVEKCILEPTQRLMAIAAKHQAAFIFFVDAGYLSRLKDFRHDPACRRDHELVAAQLRQLTAAGHEIALHVHPHWEDSVFENGAWRLDTSRYKLADFSKEEVQVLVSKYHQTIREITGEPCRSYRAGGWCIQPFGPIRQALQENHIYTDSTVYYKGYHDSPAHAYDFRTAPDLSDWRFDQDPCLPQKDGPFREIPVTPDRIPPLFYWQLYLNMRYKPELYRPVGDGSWLADRKRVRRHFYTGTDHFACCDGFFASRLRSILRKAERQERERLMILSHPKSMAPYSFQALDEFIIFARAKGHRFQAISA